jgi:hypothetical protein
MHAQQRKEIRYRGISRAMADTSVRDGGVAESVNIIVDNEELAPIVAPKIISTLPAGIDYDLLYIHSTSNYKNYIGVHQGKLCKVDPGGVTDFYTLEAGESVASIKGIGNTLVIATDDRMFYILYKDGQYEYLGEQVPFPDIKIYPYFPEGNQKEAKAFIGNVYYSQWGDSVLAIVGEGRLGIVDNFYYGVDGEYPIEQNTTYSILAKGLSELLWGKIEQSMKELRRDSMFASAILVRYAVRLFDGSYIRHSVPFLLGFSGPFIGPVTHVSEDLGGDTDSCYAVCNIQNAYQLGISLMTDYAALAPWSDIIKGVDFFVSEPIHKDYKYNGLLTGITSGAYSIQQEDHPEELLTNTSLFYRIKTLDITEFENFTGEVFDDIGEAIKDTDALRTRPQLTDDYRSHHKISASTLFEFNSRLNIANIKCQYYPGPPRYASETILQGSPGVTFTPWTMKFYIKGEDGVSVRVITGYNFGASAPGPWIVYPDSRCYKVDVYNDGTLKTLTMKEHPLLNCAYYFGGFDTSYYQLYKEGAPAGQINQETNNLTYMSNYLMQSEVNNPFFFPLTGRHIVAGGKILGVATTTKALSQGQFGQFPLYVFCSDGIWAMETAPDGTYSHIVPASRDVCINPDSITGIDGAVIFVSKRGVMLLEGSNVSCISEVMDGLHFRADSLEGVPEACATFWGSDLPDRISDDLSFIDYVSQAAIAYDYANQRLIFANYTKPYQYIYSLKSNTWHKLFAEGGLYITRTLNSYPDCYLQACDVLGCPVYNFSHVDDVNDIKTRTFGIVVSRSLDLDMPGVLKTIMQIKHRGHFTKYSVRMVLLGSRDERNYVRVRSLKGTSYKTYKIVLFLNLLPTERLSWTDLIYNEKFNNKLR